MIKLVFCLRRRADLSPEKFRAYWRDVHAPLVRERARALGIRRYVQSDYCSAGALQGMLDARGGMEPCYDGVAELWFDSLEALERSGQHPDARQAGRELLEDERQFIDLARSPIFFADERPILP